MPMRMNSPGLWLAPILATKRHKNHKLIRKAFFVLLVPHCGWNLQQLGFNQRKLSVDYSI